MTIAYDNRSRVSSLTDVFGQVVSNAYDASSNRTQLSLNATTNASYQYDAINRLTTLTDAASLNTTFSYDSTDKLTSRTLPNGVVTTSQYDDLNRLTRLTHAKAGNTLADFQYQLNAVNNITQMIDGAGTHNYTYDMRDRLTAATHPNQTNESYSLDDVGNRTASHQGSSYSYQAFNRLVAANSNSYGYDPNGNLTAKSDASGSWTYNWDYENRLKQASKSGGVTVTYSYDALGRRVQRTSSSGGTTKFVYDGADVVRDLDGSGNTVADYLNAPGIDNKIRQTISGAQAYFLTGHLGTTHAFADANGSISSNLDYDSFGNVVSGSASTRYTYTGREVDSDIDLTYYRARWYDQRQGRFISEDPIGLAGGDANLYGYVWRNPINYKDPLGLDGWGNDAADWLDQRIGYASNFWKYNDQEWIANGVNKSVADLAYGFSDLLRVGSGFGHAIYDPNDNNYGRAAAILQDISRATAIFSLLAGPATRITPTNTIACPVKVGEFSIVDWSNYPAGVPKPTGPFRLLEGAEYEAARTAANMANRTIRKQQRLGGKPFDVHEVQPIKFGGSPTNPANKIVLPRAVHRQQVTPCGINFSGASTGLESSIHESKRKPKGLVSK